MNKYKDKHGVTRWQWQAPSGRMVQGSNSAKIYLCEWRTGLKTAHVRWDEENQEWVWECYTRRGFDSAEPMTGEEVEKILEDWNGDFGGRRYGGFVDPRLPQTFRPEEAV